MIQFLHRPACGIIRPAAVIQVRKGTEVRIGICLFQHGGKGFLLQAHQGSVIRNGKIRRNIQSRKVLLHKMQAERIHRADGRALQKQLLAAQVDAAINPGNSGGPAMHGGKVVGIAFQGASSAQNIGYIIPCSVLKHFLEDIADGRLDGFPDVPFRSESLENPDLRRSLKMKEEMSGVLVTELPELLKKEVPLQPGDVVLKVNGRKIANDGTIDLGRGKVLFSGCLFWERQLGTVLPITILRDGAEKSIETKTVKFPFRVPNQLYDRNPSYYLAGGIVFTPLTINYMSTWKNFDQVPDDLAVNLGKSRNLPDEEIVVISMVLADEVNLGYQRVGADIVSTVNGVKITSLRQLAALIDSQKEGFLEIVLQNGMRLVMDIARVREATPRVMHRYRIPNDRSSDLKL